MQLDFFAADAAPVVQALRPPPLAQRPFGLSVIDDDLAVLSSTATYLGLYGHTVNSADGGQAVIDAMREALEAGEQFDLIVTDLGMPYVDGNRVAVAAKQLVANTPVVLLTSWGQRMAADDQNPAHVDFCAFQAVGSGRTARCFCSAQSPSSPSP